MHSIYRRITLDAQERAAAVTRAILIIVHDAMRDWWDGDPSHLSIVRAKIEALLREEFDDARLQRIVDDTEEAEQDRLGEDDSE